MGKHAKLNEEIENRLRDVLAAVNDSHLLEPAVAFETHVVIGVGEDQLHLAGNKSFQAALLSSVLPDAKEVTTLVCTIGPRLEQETRKRLAKNEAVYALLFDGIGSVAVETLGQEACKRISSEASSRGLQASSPLAPGMPHFSIQEQAQLLQLAQAERIGVSLTPSGLMIPEKSISMVIGLGEQMPTWTQADACAHCNLRDSCHYRIHI
jgi:hypothetical protein